MDERWNLKHEALTNTLVKDGRLLIVFIKLLKELTKAPILDSSGLPSARRLG